MGQGCKKRVKGRHVSRSKVVREGSQGPPKVNFYSVGDAEVLSMVVAKYRALLNLLATYDGTVDCHMSFGNILRLKTHASCY